MFAFTSISQGWNGTGCWNASSWKTWSHLSWVDTMVADDLAPCVARASATMASTWLSWNILVSAPEGLILYRLNSYEETKTYKMVFIITQLCNIIWKYLPVFSSSPSLPLGEDSSHLLAKQRSYQHVRHHETQRGVRGARHQRRSVQHHRRPQVVVSQTVILGT